MSQFPSGICFLTRRMRTWCNPSPADRDHGRAWYREGESYFYKQGVCVLSLEEKECQGEELSQSPPGMDGTPSVDHRPGGLPEEVGPAGLLSVEVEAGRRRRKTPAETTACAKAQRQQTRTHSVIATIYSQSGTFTFNLHSSSVRWEVVLPCHRTCWLRKIEGLVVVTQLVSGPAHFPRLRWAEKRGPAARSATGEYAGSSCTMGKESGLCRGQ